MVQVRDVLSSKGNGEVFTVSPDATISDLLDALAEHNIGALVVSNDGVDVLGIVSERDVVRKLRGMVDAGSVPVSQIMTTELRVCSPDDSFESLLSTMTDHRVRHVPVLEEGRLVGVLSIGDAVKHRMDQLAFERDQLSNYVAGG